MLSISGARSRFRSGFATGPLGSGACACVPMTAPTSTTPANQIASLMDRSIITISSLFFFSPISAAAKKRSQRGCHLVGEFLMDRKLADRQQHGADIGQSGERRHLGLRFRRRIGAVDEQDGFGHPLCSVKKFLAACHRVELAYHEADRGVTR